VVVRGAFELKQPDLTLYRVRFTAGADGTARILLPQGGIWTFSASFASGFLDTSRSTTLRLGTSIPRGKVEVFGLMNWQPDRKESLALFQSDQPISEPMTAEDVKATGAALSRVRNVGIRTLAYTAEMSLDLPHLLVLTPSGHLVHAGTITSTSDGWRCDLTLAPEHQQR
jgi:hypothetical protein